MIYNYRKLIDESFESYTKLVSMYKKNKTMNHKINISYDVSLVYGITTKGDILVHIGLGNIMKFLDFICYCENNL